MNEYNKKIDTVNAVTVMMNEKGFSLQEAVDYVAKSYTEFGDIMNGRNTRTVIVTSLTQTKLRAPARS